MPNQTEFRMTTDLAAVAPKELSFNYEELKSFLTTALSDYRNLIVTEDSIAEAKAARARVNKVAKAINDQKIAVKKQLMAVYDREFEPKCKELIVLCQEVSDGIDGQVTSFEERDKEVKIAELRAIYESGDEEVKAYCPWERIYSQKWENKSFPKVDAETAIKDAFDKTAADLFTIRGMSGQDIAPLLDEYKRTWDIGAVVRKAETLKSLREAEENRSPKVIDASEPDAFSKAKPGDIIRFGGEGCESSEFGWDSDPFKRELKRHNLTVSFRASGTKEQLMALSNYMQENGIQFEKI